MLWKQFWFSLTLPVLRSINGGSLRNSVKHRSSRDSCSRSRPTCCPSSKTRTWTVAKQPSNRAPNPHRTLNLKGKSPRSALAWIQQCNHRTLTLRRHGPVKLTVWRKLQTTSYLSLTSKAPLLTLRQSERWTLAARRHHTDYCRMLSFACVYSLPLLWVCCVYIAMASCWCGMYGCFVEELRD